MRIWVQCYKPFYFNTFSVWPSDPDWPKISGPVSECRTDEPNEGEDQSGLRLRLQEQGEHRDQNSKFESSKSFKMI